MVIGISRLVFGCSAGGVLRDWDSGLERYSVLGPGRLAVAKGPSDPADTDPGLSMPFLEHCATTGFSGSGDRIDLQRLRSFVGKSAGDSIDLADLRRAGQRIWDHGMDIMQISQANTERYGRLVNVPEAFVLPGSEIERNVWFKDTLSATGIRPRKARDSRPEGWLDRDPQAQSGRLFRALTPRRCRQRGPEPAGWFHCATSG